MLAPPGTSESNLTLSVDRSAAAVVVTVAGEIDLTTAARLNDVLEVEIAAGPSALVVDLEDVGFFTSVGLTALALAQRAARAAGVDLRVVATSRTVLRPLQITGMADTLALYASRDAAVDGATGTSAV